MSRRKCAAPDCDNEIPPRAAGVRGRGRTKWCCDECRQRTLRGTGKRRHSNGARSNACGASLRRNLKGRHAATRTCLGCGKPFLSEGPWNRICKRCGRRDTRRAPQRVPPNVLGAAGPPADEPCLDEEDFADVRRHL